MEANIDFIIYATGHSADMPGNRTRVRLHLALILAYGVKEWVADYAGTEVKMPARGTLARALLPHVSPHVRWYTGRVAVSFAPEAVTPLDDLWQVLSPP